MPHHIAPHAASALVPLLPVGQSGAQTDVDGGLLHAGLRRTRAARAVLGLFVADGALSLTHADVESALGLQGLSVNRVTLYRLLDRLATAGLLSRQADQGARTWRFSLAPEALGVGAGELGVVPRFECDACHRQFHLAEASPPTQAVAEQLLKTLATLGHQGQRVDLSVHGTCAVCVEPPEPGSDVR